MFKFDKSLVWFRRDLRCFDHAALYHALRQSRSVHCAFVFDTSILQDLPRHDRRIDFIHASIVELDEELRALGGGLTVLHGKAEQEIEALAQRLGADAVFVNRDYEPQALSRDAAVARSLQERGRAFLSYKDQAIFDMDEVLSKSGKPFSVFTPYKNAWLKKLHEGGDDFFLQAYPIEKYRDRFAAPERQTIPGLAALGFERTDLRELGVTPGMQGGQALIDAFLPRLDAYHIDRDYPAIEGTSCLSVHLRFGTVSVRALARRALEAMRLRGSTGAATWLGELIWRDFYFMILHAHPHVAHQAFKPQYDAVQWESGEDADALFDAWCQGKTGYPLVDAAMLQINRTGFMHNRLRMVTASFLIKDLGIDWRRGERYFAEKLNDYDLSANNGGWQWAASSGCDAQPFFRIFNPVTQSQKFDKDGAFIKRYLPQLSELPGKYLHAPWLAPAAVLRKAGIELGRDYPLPVIGHESARRATLRRYDVVKKKAVADDDE